MPSLTELVNLNWNLYAVIFGSVLYLLGIGGIAIFTLADFKTGGDALRVLILSLLVCGAGGLCVVNHLP